MYKNVLILSDNLSLCVSVKNLILDSNISDNVNWSFATSPYSNTQEFSKKLCSSVKKINLKDPKSIDKLCIAYDLILSIHCKQLFPLKLITTVKCINVHPGYNPINRGWYPQVFAIINKTQIGATIHEIDEKLDHGLIIDRELVNMRSWDTSLTLYNKILDKELMLLEKNLPAIIANNYSVLKPENEGKLYLKKDFNQLKKINLSEKLTMQDALNRLRALTHGEFNNAFYIDPETNKKIFVKVTLEPDMTDMD